MRQLSMHIAYQGCTGRLHSLHSHQTSRTPRPLARRTEGPGPCVHKGSCRGLRAWPCLTASSQKPPGKPHKCEHGDMVRDGVRFPTALQAAPSQYRILQRSACVCAGHVATCVSPAFIDDGVPLAMTHELWEWEEGRAVCVGWGFGGELFFHGRPAKLLMHDECSSSPSDGTEHSSKEARLLPHLHPPTCR